MKRNCFIRILSYMKKNIFIYLISLLILGLCGFAVQAFLATLFNEMFDAIERGNINQMLQSVKFYALLIVGIFLIFPIFAYIVNKIIYITTGNIRKAVFQKLEKLPVSFFKNNHSGDIVSRMTNDISETEKVYDTIFTEVVVTLIIAIGGIFYSFYLDWRLAIISIIGAGLTLFVNLYYVKILRVLGKKVQENLALLNKTLTNLLDGVHVIRVFNLQKLMMKKIGNNNQDVYDVSVKRVNTQAVISALNALSGFISFGGLMCVGVYLSIQGSTTIGAIVAIAQLQNGIRNLARLLGTFITNMQSSLAASERVFEVLDEEEEPVSYTLETENNKTNHIIDMENLSFKYDDNLVLEKLSLSIPKGKVYALVGPSGGGKSTVFKLILNFYKPSSGDLLINGESISQQKITDIRKQMAYVPQDAYLFTGSIEDNIRHGNKDATQEEIIQAAKAANAHEFIIEMENGYNTKVGERGTQLSGGQRQRIAIARAILKNAPILLLDEATSALDTESECLVQEALNQLMIGKTTLVVAHRLQTIQNADQILVLKDGHIVEQGTHDELLTLGNVYKNLYNKQFKVA
ncbi:ABC transporter ATP-binding protein [Mycoplasmatota bacterium]|nr:ABC transporter ATP-binding protein [Mycoplasmatota bacterium]